MRRVGEVERQRFGTMSLEIECRRAPAEHLAERGFAAVHAAQHTGVDEDRKGIDAGAERLFRRRYPIVTRHPRRAEDRFGVGPVVSDLDAVDPRFVGDRDVAEVEQQIGLFPPRGEREGLAQGVELFSGEALRRERALDLPREPGRVVEIRLDRRGDLSAGDLPVVLTERKFFAAPVIEIQDLLRAEWFELRADGGEAQERKDGTYSSGHKQTFHR